MRRVVMIFTVIAISVNFFEKKEKASLELPEEEKQNKVEFESLIPSRSVGILMHKFFVKKRLANELQRIIQDSVLELIPTGKKTEIISPV